MKKIRQVFAARLAWLLIAPMVFAVLAITFFGVDLWMGNASTTGEPVVNKSTQAQKSSRLFNPDRPERISVESEAVTISLDGVQPCNDCNTGPALFTFVVNNKLQRTTTRFTIQNETAQIDEVVIAGPSRAVVFGSVSGTVRSLNIVDIETGLVLDYFYGLFPSISKDGRFLAYVKSAPRFSAPQDWSYVYLVYDLTISPAQNKVVQDESSDEAIGDRANVGMPVYPSQNATRKIYNTSVNEASPRDASTAHILASEELFWIKENVFAFVDRWKRANRLVVVDLSLGIGQAKVRIQPIDTMALIDLKSCSESVNAPENLIHVASISLSKGKGRSVHLAFEPRGRCLLRTTLDMSYLQ